MWFWIIVIVSAVAVIKLISATLRKVTVEEATAVSFKAFGRFCYCAMEYSGKHFDARGDIVDGLGRKGYGPLPLLRIGGWVFYLRPFVRPANYAETNDPDKFGKGIHVLLGDITPEIVVVKAETREDDGSAIPLNLKLVARMRVKNPYLWTFVAPRDASTQVAKRLVTLLRSWVGSGDERHAQAAKGDGVALWAEINSAPINGQALIRQMLNDWGLEIVPESIVVEDVDYPPEYQAAKQSSSQARLEAAGDVESSSGRVVREVAKQSGLEVEELEALLRRDPTLRTKPASKGGFKEAFRFAEDMARRGRATRSGIQEIRIGAVDGSTMPNLQMVGGAAGFALSESKKSRKKGDEDDDSKMRRAMRA